jgi:hypothetical protein
LLRFVRVEGWIEGWSESWDEVETALVRQLRRRCLAAVKRHHPGLLGRARQVARASDTERTLRMCEDAAASMRREEFALLLERFPPLPEL